MEKRMRLSGKWKAPALFHFQRLWIYLEEREK